jgi:malonyl CoA-acyl carrier protein transacylase
MAAILGLDATTVVQVCAEAAQGQVCSPANFNSPAQTVIAGHVHAVVRAVAGAKARGARHTVMLKVSAPFHCALMRKAQDGLEVPLRELAFKDLESPLVNNVDAAIVTTGEAARDGLVRQITAPVRWNESILKLMKGSEFVRLISRLGRSRGILVRLVSGRGKGSHATLYFGEARTIIQDLKRELPSGTFRAMLRQLGLSPADLDQEN